MIGRRNILIIYAIIQTINFVWTVESYAITEKRIISFYKKNTLKTDSIFQINQDTTINYIPFKIRKNTDTIANNITLINNLINITTKGRLQSNLKDWLITTNETKKQKNTPNNLALENYKFQNKIINKIQIKQIDPFGPTIDFPNRTPKSKLSKFGNKMRIPTSQNLILHHITFSEGDRLNIENLQESERILRSRPYINDIIIQANICKDTNRIDILIIIQDNYPHAFSLDISNSITQTNIYSKNLWGQGIGFTHGIITSPNEKQEIGYIGKYSHSNLWGNFVDLNVSYKNYYQKHNFEIDISKTFQLKSTKTAGGYYFNRSYRNQQLYNTAAINWPQMLDFKAQNSWIGRAFTLNTTNYLNKSIFYILAEHLYTNCFNIDQLNNHDLLQNSNTIFLSLSLAKRNYYKNNYIYHYGQTEDVPYGFLTSFSIGRNITPNYHRNFWGINFSFGKAILPSKGYIYSSIDFKNYINNNKIEQGTLKLQSSYISRLFRLFTQKSRFFCNTIYTHGFNRLPGEYLTINENDDGLTSFIDPSLMGIKKITIKMENILFFSRTLAGFNFSCFSFADGGLISSKENTLLNSKIISSLGCGIRLQNNKLVFNKIQIKFAYFINQPPNLDPTNMRIEGKQDKYFNDFEPQKPSINIFK